MKWFANLLILNLRFYQRFLSPLKSLLLGPHCHCRFSPTCSQFAIRTLRTKPLWKALKLILLRLSRCHPFYRK
ncbi:MAG: membrane protein insertion efficiency factor YidD [Puniceicoccales bacterium]|nr:membrane protein insertion efficiency factor YidD [Puniceicoccales bacterium]